MGVWSPGQWRLATCWCLFTLAAHKMLPLWLFPLLQSEKNAVHRSERGTEVQRSEGWPGHGHSPAGPADLSLPFLCPSPYTTAGRTQGPPGSDAGSEARLTTPGTQATGPWPHTESPASGSLGHSPWVMGPVVIGSQGLVPSSLTIGLATYFVGCLVQQVGRKCW